MSDKQHKVSEDQIAVEQMPEEVQRLVAVMSGINPEWGLDEWLSEQANMALDLINADLSREKLVLEQRLHRLEAIGHRLNVLDNQESDPYQRNIFDCFELKIDSGLNGLGKRTADSEDRIHEQNIDTTLHPANNFIELLPDEESDDPLLAVVCQMLLIHVETEMSQGQPCATLETIFKHLNSSGISPEEIDEALDHLLMNGTLVEIDDDCFVSTN
ncbi:MAG: hypothetical protein HOL22_02635 [Euryarchaeota archaeon]|jgi:hypothetical protein|nr:hypothetical protein [Euryarchaeota archaeon]MBT5594826.1 hypothetical protein [Euryarchaeota archaeon]MBT5843817.1 hypothetical protein [Euryarchaeota archaeon]MBT6640138.1 hypothetical protein [Euryarchaeota archaeon]MBT6845364.1 hypothetical protein [Euryarchaeota archaeon]